MRVSILVHTSRMHAFRVHPVKNTPIQKVNYICMPTQKVSYICELTLKMNTPQIQSWSHKHYFPSSPSNTLHTHSPLVLDTFFRHNRS